MTTTTTKVLEKGLRKNFEDAKVCVSECPDLSQEPFKFPVKGLCGNPRITDVGGVPYLIPLVKVDKVYNMNTIAKELELPGAFILGAGAVSSNTVGMNGELMPLVLTKRDGKPAVNASYFSSINPVDGKCLQEKYSDRFCDCDFGLLANLYACEGQPGKVLEVRASRRTGEDSLVSCMRKTMEEHYGDKSIALGGTFIIQKGKAKIHIMPREFSSCPLNTNEDVNNWLKHFEVSAPLICQSVMVSKDPGLDLRVEHTHGFSDHGEGGHYYIDTTPSTVEYLGYFLPAEFVYRIDQPVKTHNVGRDKISCEITKQTIVIWSQRGSQRPPGRPDSMATAPGFKQGGFPSGSATTQIQNKTMGTKQPMKQQSFIRNIKQPKDSFTTSDVTARSPKTAAQTQNSQWKFRSGSLRGGTWVENTFGALGSQSSLQQQEKAPPKKSLRILTAVIEGMKHWSQFKDKVPMMFEIFAVLDSAVTIGKYGAKNFLLRDGKDTVPCVYYENDQVLPRLIRGQVHRCVGNYDRQKNTLTCVSVRAASLSEQRNAQEAVKASDAEMRKEVQAFSEM
ncbi:ester hydrolase C11orf54-like [Silurus meridionalis]|nr:ester hydrolase C11orf54-like [Silurus meridionalis]